MGDSSNKSENIWKKGVAHVIDLLSSLFLPFINLMVSVGILKRYFGTYGCKWDSYRWNSNL